MRKGKRDIRGRTPTRRIRKERRNSRGRTRPGGIRNVKKTPAEGRSRTRNDPRMDADARGNCCRWWNRRHVEVADRGSIVRDERSDVAGSCEAGVRDERRDVAGSCEEWVRDGRSDVAEKMPTADGTRARCDGAEGAGARAPRPATPPNDRASARELAGSTGLEPAASGVTGQRSNQLNYDPERTCVSTVRSAERGLRARWCHPTLGTPHIELCTVVGGTGLEPVTAGV
jgi:hypothetical protein